MLVQRAHVALAALWVAWGRPNRPGLIFTYICGLGPPSFASILPVTSCLTLLRLHNATLDDVDCRSRPFGRLVRTPVEKEDPTQQSRFSLARIEHFSFFKEIPAV